MEDEKVAPLGLSDQLPSAQGLLQATPAPTPYSISQVWSPKLVLPFLLDHFHLNGILFFMLN